jgi:hypothetical protein
MGKQSNMNLIVVFLFTIWVFFINFLCFSEAQAQEHKQTKPDKAIGKHPSQQAHWELSGREFHLQTIGFEPGTFFPEVPEWAIPVSHNPWSPLFGF